MPTIPIDEIVVNRDRRVRKEVLQSSISALAESISRLGFLINPITITREKVLIAGETRLLAVTSLGWTEIDFRYFDELDEIAQLAIELEENVKRTDLPWKDQCDALLRFHTLQKSVNASWTQVDTAKAIGLAQRTVSDQLAVADEVSRGNTRVADAPKYSIARRVTKISVERRVDAEKTTLSLESPPEKPETPILTGDFISFAESYSDTPFNFIHCDFPYGINSHKSPEHKLYAGHSLGTYDDSPEAANALRHALRTNAKKLLGDSGHILFWFSMHQYTELLAWLKEWLWVDPFPLIWDKGSQGIIPNPEMGPRRAYETAFLCSYSERKILQPVSNIYKSPIVREAGHTSEKSVDMLMHFFRMIVDEKTRMLDPTCGSASSLRAARNLNCGFLLGLEFNPDYAESARGAWLADEL